MDTLRGDVRLLIVEDEPSLAEALHRSLGAQGFRPTLAGSAEAAWEALLAHPFDLILLDVMLPEGRDAGFEWARAIREAGFRQPILFLSAREALPDRLQGLAHGDDYLAKPFAPAEVIARLKALYRRGEVRSRVVRWRNVELRVEERQVLRDGSMIRLTAKEYEILEVLMLNPGRIFSREEILERVWGPEYESGSPTNLVEVYVKNLRNKVDPASIETIRGSGYRFPG